MLTQTVEVHEAQTRLLELLGAMKAGSEVIFTKDDKPIARLVPIVSAAMSRVAGLHLGAISTSEDFDKPLPDAFWVGDV